MKAPFEIYMHINFTEQGTPLEQALALAKRWGFDGVEARRSDLYGSLSAESYLEALCRAFDKSGLTGLVLGGPPVNLVQSDSSRRAGEIEAALDFYEACRTRLPLRGINFLTGEVHHPDPSVYIHDWHRHGSAAATAEQWAWAVEGGRVLARYFESVGIDAGIETHMRHLHDRIDSTLRLVEGIGSPRVGVTLDAGNLLKLKDPPTLEEIVAALGPQGKMTHLKNMTRTFGGEVCGARLKDGDINNRQFLVLLRAAGAGPILTIEAPGSGDRLVWAEEDCAYLRGLVDDLGSVAVPRSGSGAANPVTRG